MRGVTETPDAPVAKAAEVKKEYVGVLSGTDVVPLLLNWKESRQATR